MTTRTPPTRSPRRRWLPLLGLGIAVIAVAAVLYTALAPAPAPAGGADGTAAGPQGTVTATSASGQQVSVPGDGKPSVLFFFTGGCSTCGPAAHAVAAAQAAHPQAANYVAVDMDPGETPAQGAAFLRANQAQDLAVTSDRDGALTRTYQVTQLSTAVTLDPAGNVVSRLVEPRTEQIAAGLAQAGAR